MTVNTLPGQYDNGLDAYLYPDDFNSNMIIAEMATRAIVGAYPCNHDAWIATTEQGMHYPYSSSYPGMLGMESANPSFAEQNDNQIYQNPERIIIDPDFDNIIPSNMAQVPYMQVADQNDFQYPFTQ